MKNFSLAVVFVVVAGLSSVIGPSAARPETSSLSEEDCWGFSQAKRGHIIVGMRSNLRTEGRHVDAKTLAT